MKHTTVRMSIKIHLKKCCRRFFWPLITFIYLSLKNKEKKFQNFIKANKNRMIQTHTHTCGQEKNLKLNAQNHFESNDDSFFCCVEIAHVCE